MAFTSYDVAAYVAPSGRGAAAGYLLHHAAHQGDPTLCQTLIVESGADLQHRNAVGEGVVHVAAARGVVAVLELLLRYGADPNMATAHRFGGRTPLHVAVKAGNLQVASLLLAHNADANVPDAFGKLPLHDAAIAGGTAMVELLLSHGSIVSAADALATTPAQYAKAQRHTATHQAIVTAQSARDGDGDGGGGPAVAAAVGLGMTTKEYAAYKDELAKRVTWREAKPQAKGKGGGKGKK
jgi:ankyrin repeat protein